MSPKPPGLRVQSAHEALEHIAAGRASFPRDYAALALRRLSEEQDQAVEQIRRRLPEDVWDVCVWKQPPSDYVFGSVDGADRTRLIRLVLEALPQSTSIAERSSQCVSDADFIGAKNTSTVLPGETSQK